MVFFHYRIFRLEDVPKHLQESEILNFPLHLDLELQTASETDYSSDSLDKRKFHTVPEKPKRKKMKKPTSSIPASQPAYPQSNDRDENYRRNLTPWRPASTNFDDLSRTSSELMLVLVPSAEDLFRYKGKGSIILFKYPHDFKLSTLLFNPKVPWTEFRTQPTKTRQICSPCLHLYRYQRPNWAVKCSSSNRSTVTASVRPKYCTKVRSPDSTNSCRRRTASTNCVNNYRSYRASNRLKIVSTMK